MNFTNGCKMVPPCKEDNTTLLEIMIQEHHGKALTLVPLVIIGTYIGQVLDAQVPSFY